MKNLSPESQQILAVVASLLGKLESNGSKVAPKVTKPVASGRVSAAAVEEARVFPIRAAVHRRARINLRAGEMENAILDILYKCGGALVTNADLIRDLSSRFGFAVTDATVSSKLAKLRQRGVVTGSWGRARLTSYSETRRG